MKLSKAQMKEAISLIYGMMIAGEPEEEILEEMGLSVDDYEKLKDAMFEAKADELRTRPHEHTYVQYLIDQIRNLRDLDDMITRYKDTKQANAMIGAIRAKSEILDKIIQKGQEFGILKKVPDRKEIVGGFVVAELSNKELRKQITKELTGLQSLVKKYGDSEIEAIEVGQIYRGPALPSAVLEDEEEKKESSKDKYHKAKTAKRSAGRRVVRTKPRREDDE